MEPGQNIAETGNRCCFKCCQFVSSQRHLSLPDIRQQRPDAVITSRVHNPEIRAFGGWFYNRELIVRQNHERRILAFGKVRCKRADQRWFELILVLPNGRGVIISTENTPGSDFGECADEIDGDTVKCMIGVDIRHIQCLIADFVDHVDCFSLTNDPTFSRKLRARHRFGLNFVEGDLIDICGFVPII